MHSAKIGRVEIDPWMRPNTDALPIASPGDGLASRIYDDSVVISNDNTTIGYARFSKDERTMEYIYVNPPFRKMGYGRLLLELCERECGGRLSPAPPISPLGQKFFTAVDRRHGER
jgi:GNAT superfamily N-acetyltransferase